LMLLRCASPPRSLPRPPG